MAAFQGLVVTGILCLTFTTFISCQQLIVSPRGDQYKDRDSSVILSCSFVDFLDAAEHLLSSSDHVTLDPRWIGPDMQPIQHKAGRVHVERVNSSTVKLYINKFRETDAGVYSCQMDARGQIFTESVQLSLYENIRFIDKPVSYGIKEGESSVLLDCSATGMPQPEVSWRFNMTRIPEFGKKYAYEKDGLRINDIALSDSGDYECRAQVESQGSLKVRSIYLDVLYAPVIVTPPHADRVIKGHEVVLHCSAHGNPPVKYEWLLEKRMSDLVKAKVPLLRGSNALRIKDVDSKDEGRYFCRVSNSVGTKEAHVDITMLVPPTIKELGRKVTLEGRTYIVPCELVSGRPSPDLFWYNLDTGQQYSGTQTTESSISVDSTQRGISKLIMENIERSQAGDYVCQAVNSVGNDSKIVSIHVDFVPSINSSATEIFGWTGQVRNLTCTAEGQPLPTVSWFSRGQRVFDTFSYKVDSITTNRSSVSTLQVTIGDKQSWIFGVYTCIAKNLHGAATAAFQLREGEVPELPHNVSVIDVTDTQAILQVAPPAKTGGIPLSSWMIRYEPIQQDAKQKTIFFDPNPGEVLTSLTIAHLQPETEYMFHLAAGNDVGYGEFIKFLVKTQERFYSKEQSDVPQNIESGNDIMNNFWKESAALEKVGFEEQGRSNSGKSSVAAVCGVIVALLVVVSLVIGLWIRNRRKNGEGIMPPGLNKLPWRGRKSAEEGDKRVPISVGKESEGIQMETVDLQDADMEDGEILKENECGGMDMVSFRGMEKSSPKPIRPYSPSSSVYGVRSLTATPSSIHKFAWEHVTREILDEELSSGFGTAEPADLSVRSDPPFPHDYYDDELGVRATDEEGLRQRDPDEDSIPDNLDLDQSEDNMDEKELEDFYGDSL